MCNYNVTLHFNVYPDSAAPAFILHHIRNACVIKVAFGVLQNVEESVQITWRVNLPLEGVSGSLGTLSATPTLYQIIHLSCC